MSKQQYYFINKRGILLFQFLLPMGVFCYDLVKALWGGYTPLGLYRIFLLSGDSFTLVAGLVKASKSDLLCVQRRKAKTLRLGAFEDI